MESSASAGRVAFAVLDHRPTSTVSVNLPGGGVGSLTAGHRFDNGTQVKSGSYHYGQTTGNSGFPTYDMESFLDPNGIGSATRQLHDECCPSPLLSKEDGPRS